jgi:hypothetical protein
MKAILAILAVIAALGYGLFSAFGGGTPPVGQVYNAAPGTTLWTMFRASQGCTGTMLLQRGADTVAFLQATKNEAWTVVILQAKYAEPGMNAKLFIHATAGRGVVINAQDMGAFVSEMAKKGWQVINPDQIPPVVTAAVSAIQKTAIVSTALNGMTTIIAVPLMQFDLDQLDKWKNVTVES